MWAHAVDDSYVSSEAWSALLTWKGVEADMQKRGSYSGKSERTQRRHRAVDRKRRREHDVSVFHAFKDSSVRAEDAEGAESDTSADTPQVVTGSASAAAAAAAATDDYADEDEFVLNDAESLEHLIESNLASTSSNRKFDHSSNHDHLRYLCIRRYFELRGAGHLKIAASMGAAMLLRVDPTEHQGRCIRKWANHYAINRVLPELFQGRHSKTGNVGTYIDDADNANALRVLLRSIPRNLRSALTFRDRVNAAYPALTISESTAGRWMHRLGFSPANLTSKTYVDGHERPDVIEYRSAFIERMGPFQARMYGYSGADMSVLLPPSNTAMLPILWMVHDESCADSAGGRQRPWIEVGHAPMLPKRGNCVMISGIVSPNGVETWKMVEPSVDGYWTNRDLIKQLEEWLPTLATKYPGYKIVLQFDNSGNHGVYAPNALIASRLNLSDGWPKLNASDKAAGMETVAFRDTTFVRGGTTYKQSFTYTDAAGKTQHKGIKSILMERGLWRDASPIVRTGWTLAECVAHNFDYDAGGLQGPQLVMSHREHQEMLLDEALELLASQPDFVAQQSHNWITETVEKHGHVAVFGPKFHPELAAIEYFWGEMKRFLRVNCDYTLPTLKTNIPRAIASVPVATFRRHFAHVMRYMRAYSEGSLTLAQIEWSMRKYTSHRRAKDPPADLDTQFLGETWFKDLPEHLKT
jgi:hypothetical protein